MKNVDDIRFEIAILQENIDELQAHIDEANPDGSLYIEMFGCNTVEEAENAICLFEEDIDGLQYNLEEICG